MMTVMNRHNPKAPASPGGKARPGSEVAGDVPPAKGVGAGQPIRVAIIDDEVLFAKVLGAWLVGVGGLIIAGYATGGHPGWELCVASRPQVVLLEVEMPDGDGLTLAQRLSENQPEIRVVLMTGRVDPHTAWRAGQTGAAGLIDKTLEPEVLGMVIRRVAQGGSYTSPAFQSILDQRLTEAEAFHKVLSSRELAVLYYVTEGWDDPAIGRHLNIAVATVACHRKKIRARLGLHDDRSLIAYGRRWGIFGGEPP
jgi:DNA-binding NarL/FixJ family response regulator